MNLRPTTLQGSCTARPSAGARARAWRPQSRTTSATRSGGAHPVLSPSGHAAPSDLGLAFDAIARQRGPLCRPCLDESGRRAHVAGPLGRALLARLRQDRV